MSSQSDPFGGTRTVPVVVIDDTARARPLAEALMRGGISCAEVTLRTPAAFGAIHAMAGVAGFRVGAGTVLNADQAHQAVESGAEFLVSPGFDRGLWEARPTLGVTVVPGVVTPTEALQAVNAGVGLVKLFPATAFGGLAVLKALSGPFPNLRFVPTGGIRLVDAAVWLRDPAVAAVGGSWLAPRGLVRGGRFEEISALARRTTEAMEGIELR